MRLARVLAVGVVALASAVVLAPGARAAAGPTAPYTAFTVDGPNTANLPTGETRVLDPSNATFTLATVGDGMSLTARGADPRPWEADMSPPSGGQFVVGQTYQTTQAADATHAGFVLSGISVCGDPGSITIRELVRDQATHAVTALAVTYRAFGSLGRPVSGELRYNSSLDYVAAGTDPNQGSFGVVDFGQKPTAKITVTSLGSAPLVLGTATVDGPYLGAFSIVTDLCKGRTLSYGQSCAVTVMAHPYGTGSQVAELLIPDNTTAAERFQPLSLVGQLGAIGTYYPLEPARILDTRKGNGAPKAPLGPGGVLHVQVAGRGGLPASDISAVLNVTVTGPTSSSYLTVYPTGIARPLTSSLNFAAGWTGANLVTVPVGAGGQVDIYNSQGKVQVIADVVGFYANTDDVLATAFQVGGQFQAVQPVRLLDTRQHGGALVPHEGRLMQIDLHSANGHVRAMVVNITAVRPTSAGYFTAWTGNNAPPSTSTLDFAAGATVSNLAIVRNGTCIPDVGCPGTPYMSVYNGSTGSTHLIVDLVGFIDDSTLSGGLRFHPTSPTRIVDSRLQQGAGPLGANQTARVRTPVSFPDAGAVALMLNVTAVDPTSGTYLTVWPDGTQRPVLSNLTPAAHQTLANGVVARLSGQTFDIYNSAGTTNVVVDVVGTFDVGVDLNNLGFRTAAPEE